MILGFLLHAFYSTICAYVLAFVFGGLKLWIAVLSLLIGTVYGLKHARVVYAKYPEWRFASFSKGMNGLIELAITVFVLYAAWRHFTWMMYPIENHWATFSANNYGDLPLHVNYIRAFAGGLEFPPRNPIFASELLRYPIGADFYNALWEIVGVRLQAHLFVVGILATFASLVLLRSFAGWWGMGAFFLNGGLAGWDFYKSTQALNSHSAVDWKNLFLSVFITQRGMLFALPLGLILLILMRGHFSGKKILNKKELTIAGLIWGFLPLFHLHAFVILSLILGFMAIEFYGPRGAWRKLISLRALQIAVFPAIFFVLYSTDFFRAAGVAHWSWGWTKTEGDSLLRFLTWNFGPWLLVPLLIAFILFQMRTSLEREKLRRLWIEFGVYCGLWLLFFNLMLAPWNWDNIKLLIWPYLGFARLLYLVFEPRLGRFLGDFEKLVCAVVLFLSGFVFISESLRLSPTRGPTIYSFADLAKTEGALIEVPRSAVFAAAPTFNHPLTYFGRLRAVGYDGHLWSHGIKGKEATQKLNRLMSGELNGQEAVHLARELGVTHIFWGPEERRRYNRDEAPGAGFLRNVSRVPDYQIFEVK